MTSSLRLDHLDLADGRAPLSQSASALTLLRLPPVERHCPLACWEWGATCTLEQKNTGEPLINDVHRFQGHAWCEEGLPIARHQTLFQCYGLGMGEKRSLWPVHL